MIKQVAILGDMTNYGGRIITASGQGYCGMDGVALLGDLVSCPKCSSTGRIIEGQTILLSMANLLPMMVVLLRVNARQSVGIEY